MEDEPLLLELAVASLEENGYRVVSASDGAAALQAWSQAGGAFDLLVTDLVLPEGVSGLELAGTLRARKPDLKILLTSGYGIDDLGRETSRRLNADFLQKPYAQLALAKAVRECLASLK